MEKIRDKSAPRVPFGHPGLAIRHPLRGLGIQIIDSKNILPEAVCNRLQFWSTTLVAERFFVGGAISLTSPLFTIEGAAIAICIGRESAGGSLYEQFLECGGLPPQIVVAGPRSRTPKAG